MFPKEKKNWVGEGVGDGRLARDTHQTLHHLRTRPRSFVRVQPLLHLHLIIVIAYNRPITLSYPSFCSASLPCSENGGANFSWLFQRLVVTRHCWASLKIHRTHVIGGSTKVLINVEECQDEVHKPSLGRWNSVVTLGNLALVHVCNEKCLFEKRVNVQHTWMKRHACWHVAVSVLKLHKTRFRPHVRGQLYAWTHFCVHSKTVHKIQRNELILGLLYLLWFTKGHNWSIKCI